MMRRISNILQVLFVGVLVGSSVSGPVSPVLADDEATKEPITITATLSPEEITVGDLVTYTLTMSHAPGIHLLPPETPKEFPGLELVDQGTSPERNRNGKTEEEFWFRLRGDRVGAHTLEGPVIVYETPSGSGALPLQEQVRAPDVTYKVRSVLYTDGEPTDIREIKPIVGSAWPWKKYVLPVAGFMALAFLIGYLANRWVKQNRIHPSKPSPPPIGEDELALRELERLYEKGYHQSGRIRELYFELSEIFRRYLGSRYRIPALDWTTEEIIQALDRRPILAGEQKEAAFRILTESDLVKFARFQVEPEDAVRLMKTTRGFIQKTARKRNTEFTQTPVEAGVEAR